LLLFRRGEVTAVSSASGGKPTASTLGGLTESDMWIVDPDGTIHAIWNDGTELDMVCMDDWLHVAGDQMAYSQKHNSNDRAVSLQLWNDIVLSSLTFGPSALDLRAILS